MRKIILLNVIVALLFNSCISRKEIAYFQDKNDEYPPKTIAENPDIQKYEPTIKPNDIISIYIASLSPEASSFFNTVNSKNADTEERTSGLPAAIGYLVDVNGNIEIPLIGQVKLGGLTTLKAAAEIKTRLEKFLLNPTVKLYYENYRITVLGEVARPGVYNVPNEKMTLPEVIGLAGDLTIFGKRENILVVREEEGKKSFARLDLRNKDIFSSPFYYLHPNDLVYVEPNRGRSAQADNFYRITPLVLNVLTLVAVLAIRLTN